MEGANTLHKALNKEPHTFLQSSPKTLKSSLQASKWFLDPLASSSTLFKRKNGLDAFHIEGFDVEQVWEEAGSLLDCILKSTGSSLAPPPAKRQKVEAAAPPSVLSESDVSDDVESEESDQEEQDPDEPIQENAVSINEKGKTKASVEKKTAQKGFLKDAFGLNDGFFNIDYFNKDTEDFESADARGMPFDPDDEEIDWDADMPDDYGGGDDDDDDDDDDVIMDSSEGGGKGKNVYYNEFFGDNASPKSDNNNMEDGTSDDEDLGLDADAEFDIGPVHRDLFAEDEDDGDHSSDDELGSTELSKSSSVHTRRQAALVQQIQELERENVAKKNWQLSGEARNSSRPMNSLLEENLDFETVGKPVPVISQEVTDTLEDMIKRRIVAEDFDELAKRHPLASHSTSRRVIEIDDSKSKQSLAQIYEEEHLRNADPESYVSGQNKQVESLKNEIKFLFTDITRKLDTLSSLQLTHKVAKPTLSIVSNTRTIEMEDAQPSTAANGSLLGHSNIAPQELYDPVSRDGKQQARIMGDILDKRGVPVSVKEMTQAERKRHRSRNKAKANKSQPGKNVKKSDDQKSQVLNNLKSANVTVIGKGGEHRDISGKAKGGEKTKRGEDFMLI